MTTKNKIKYTKKTVSFSPKGLSVGFELQKQLGYRTFSEMVERVLIEHYDIHNYNGKKHEKNN